MTAAEKIQNLLIIEDVAKIAGCSVRHIHDEIKRGNLKALRLGRRLRFEEIEVLKWAKRKTV
ncbi:MAG: helix-turn-helix domain-containing protein [Pseudobdellovibrionaceae bacterium]